MEFVRNVPQAKDFFEVWPSVAQHVITYAKRKKDNLDVKSLLSKLYGNGYDDDMINDDVEPSAGENSTFA